VVGYLPTTITINQFQIPTFAPGQVMATHSARINCGVLYIPDLIGCALSTHMGKPLHVVEHRVIRLQSKITNNNKVHGLFHHLKNTRLS
jgi:hypothetical protein